MNVRTRSEVARRTPGLAVAIAAAAGLGLGVAPATADWLVTKDGARIETKGAWRVEGKRVLFDLPNGTLSVMRADDVDLDQSAVATADARTAAENPAPPVAPKKEPVMRLTEKDIPPMGAAALEAAESQAPTEGGEGAAAEAPAAAEAKTNLEVISWEKTESGTGDAVEIFGTLRNNSPNMITSPSLMVAIYDSDGGLLATNNGIVNSPQIAAGKTANFRVTFSGLTDFASVRFDAQGRGFKQRGEESGEDEDAAEELPIDSEIEPTDAEPPSTL